jgi:hypothetical protein
MKLLRELWCRLRYGHDTYWHGSMEAPYRQTIWCDRCGKVFEE